MIVDKFTQSIATMLPGVLPFAQSLLLARVYSHFLAVIASKLSKLSS